VVTQADGGAAVSSDHPADRGRISDDLAALTVIARRPNVPGYDRDCGRGDGCVFGPAWKDIDRNGCDTRNDILRRDLAAVTVKPGTHGCKVTSGRLSDPYSGSQVAFSTDNPDAVEVDHIVPLRAAWDYGAARWPIAKREQLANDPKNLVAVARTSNRAKSDTTPGDQLNPTNWRPATRAGRCFYGRRYVAVAAAYQLPISRADRAVLQQALDECENR
jgi:hypothetical protein